MTNVTDRFSSAMDRRDQGPNEAIAQEIVDADDQGLLQEVVQVLQSNTPVRLKNDAVMVLMAVSRFKPGLLTDHTHLLISLLASRSNRQVWGSMTALANLSPLISGKLLPHLTQVLVAMDEGTVVTRDHGFTILTELYQKDQSGDLLALIKEQLLKAPPNQVGQYTEKFIDVVRREDVPPFIEALEIRSQELTNEHHLKRLNKNMLRLQAIL